MERWSIWENHVARGSMALFNENWWCNSPDITIKGILKEWVYVIKFNQSYLINLGLLIIWIKQTKLPCVVFPQELVQVCTLNVLQISDAGGAQKELYCRFRMIWTTNHIVNVL